MFPKWSKISLFVKIHDAITMPKSSPNDPLPNFIVDMDACYCIFLYVHRVINFSFGLIWPLHFVGWFQEGRPFLTACYPNLFAFTWCADSSLSNSNLLYAGLVSTPSWHYSTHHSPTGHITAMPYKEKRHNAFCLFDFWNKQFNRKWNS